MDSKPTAPHLQRGISTEQLACEHLQASGLKLLQQNYRLKIGEIDLIMLDGRTIVFVEVRYRKNNRYGGALHSIDPRKQARIIRTAQHYLQYRAPDAQARFDVVAVEGSNHIHWIRNAFESG
ncbi:MAG: YraN family protein [Thiothrix sp.]